MAETPADVRLVRCPKCENLLPEVADYSVYQCGGCGAVLRAKNKNVVSDAFSETSDEEILGGGFDKFSENYGNFNFPKTRVMNPSDGYENDVKSTGSSSSRAGEYNNGSRTKAEKWVAEEDLELNKNTHEMGISETTQRFEDLKLESGSSTNGSRRSVRTFDWRSREKGEMNRFQNTQRIDLEGLRKSEGPSNYRLGPDYDYAELMNNRNGPGAVNRVEYIEDDRAELLRKLDELKDQISRSGQMVDRSKEQVSLGRRADHQDPCYSGPENWFPDGSNKVLTKYPMPDNMTGPRSYGDPSLQTSNHVQGFGDPFGSHMVRRAPQRAPERFEQWPSHPYYSGQYINNDPANIDMREHYSNNRNLHHPSCSCFHCYNKHHQVPPPMATSILSNDRFSDVTNNPMFYNHENPNAFAPRGYNPRFPNYPSVNSRTSQWSGDANSELGGFVRSRPRRVLLATGGRRSHPVAGGAPFITCCNCFELLQLPKKVSSMGRTQKKMRCAACSEVIFFSVVDKKLVLSIHSETEGILKKVENRFNPVLDNNNSHIQGHAKWASTDFSSNEYDNSGYDFQSMDTEVVSSPTGPSLSLNKSAAMRSLHSTSSCTSGDDDTSRGLIASKDEPKVAEVATKPNPFPPPSGSPLQDHFDYSTKYNRAGIGNRSGRSEAKKVMPPLKTASRQNSMKEVTEIEIPSNEYCNNTGTSQESGDVIREEDQMRGNRGGESFFAGIIKKSFRDFSRSSQNVEQEHINVTVNGHPIPDRLVKKAERLAGRIRPGNYWYDSRAGFWGVIGGPCRGIIPPFIEEFNYPMPEKCADGNTGVFVNGRELHQKDLDLLGSRGLPTDKDRSYIIEISGRVLDEDSGEELDSLGKLAPTVQKAKHGFGMKVPRVAS